MYLWTSCEYEILYVLVSGCMGRRKMRWISPASVTMILKVASVDVWGRVLLHPLWFRLVRGRFIFYLFSFMWLHIHIWVREKCTLNTDWKKWHIFTITGEFMRRLWLAVSTYLKRKKCQYIINTNIQNEAWQFRMMWIHFYYVFVYSQRL